MGKKIITNLRWKFLLNLTYDAVRSFLYKRFDPNWLWFVIQFSVQYPYKQVTLHLATTMRIPVFSINNLNVQISQFWSCHFFFLDSYSPSFLWHISGISLFWYLPFRGKYQNMEATYTSEKARIRMVPIIQVFFPLIVLIFMLTNFSQLTKMFLVVVSLDDGEVFFCFCQVQI